MNELIQTQGSQRNRRLCLLATASALTLASSAFVQACAEARDAAPTVWIELGGQLQRDDGGQSPFAPKFASGPRPDFETFSPTGSQHLPRYSFGGEGKITFRPEDTDWTFSASVLYGRSNRDKSYHDQKTYAITGTLAPIFPTFSVPGYLFSDLRAQHSESHTILDFKAGKDVGLGVFGRHGESTLDLGVRFAQFNSKSSTSMRSMPQALAPKYISFVQKSLPLTYQRSFSATQSASRSFQGLGPTISWDASSVVAGNDPTAELTFDWGVNAALLFGRQKAKVHHHTTATLHSAGMTQIPTEALYTRRPPDSIRSRSMIVPNLGGFAGFSMKFPNGKVSLGYRADFFFGAMDGGIDTRKTYDRSFYGPFATIGIGL